MPESTRERKEREAANSAAKVPPYVLESCPRWDVRLAGLTESTPEHLVSYDWEPDHEDDTKLVLRKTIWTKSYRLSDSHIAWQGDIVTLQRKEVPDFVKFLVSCLS